MKKVYINTILTISLLTSSLYSGITVYLENNYGARLNVRTSPVQPEGVYISNNVRVYLGDIDYIPELQIRTTGTGSTYLSPYYSLNHFLTDIKLQKSKHSNDDAIIAVETSGYISNWKIALRWEPKGTIKSFEYADFPHLIGVPKVKPSTPEPLTEPAIMINVEELEQELALMEITTADGRLNRIKNGALGPDYARKATDICNANYTKAEQLGKINLCSRLKTEIIAPQFNIASPKGKAFQQEVAKAKKAKKKIIYMPAPDLAPAINDIKNSIDKLHNALAGYKSRGEAK
jgi:hypothetical protein